MNTRPGPFYSLSLWDSFDHAFVVKLFKFFVESGNILGIMSVLIFFSALTRVQFNIYSLHCFLAIHVSYVHMLVHL